MGGGWGAGRVAVSDSGLCLADGVAVVRKEYHRAERFRSAVPGIEAFALASARSFPRHAHDHFGLGVLDSGGASLVERGGGGGGGGGAT